VLAAAPKWRITGYPSRLWVVSSLDYAPRTRVITVSNATIVLNVGLIAAGVAVALSVLTRTTAASTEIGPLPIALALIALVIGIPHGAVDNLTITRQLTTYQRIAGALVYLAVAAIAALAIITWPGWAFVAVLAMTVWHFGTGDVEATRELQNLPPLHGWFRIPYAIALGSAPVLLPLTSPAAIATLTAIEPRLTTVLSEPVIVGARIGVLTLIVVCLLWLIQRGDIRGAIELFALAVLGYVASPLVAFAVYFGFWHALRHTARLALATHGSITMRSLVHVSRGGIPSLTAFVVVVLIAATFFDTALSIGPMLWFGLAIIWGLTVPHMILVSRFDARMRAREMNVN
jgi:Brp/Blh family beta-carotene 15,15'-monooxygenase